MKLNWNVLYISRTTLSKPTSVHSLPTTTTLTTFTTTTAPAFHVPTAKIGGSSQLSTASTSRSAANAQRHDDRPARRPSSSSSSSPSSFRAAAVDPELERTFRGRGAPVTGVSYSPDMKQLVSSAADNNLMVWTFRAQLRVRFLVVCKRRVQRVSCALGSWGMGVLL